MPHPIRQPLSPSLAGLAAILSLGACDTSTELVPPLAVVANPQAITCNPGQTTQIGLTISGGTRTPVVTFAVTGSDAVVSQNGVVATVTCGNTPGAGQIVYTVTSGREMVTGTIPITRTQTGFPPGGTSLLVTPTSVALTPGATAQLGATVTLPPSAPANTSTAVTWTSADTTIAAVSASGLVTARRVGQTIVTATAMMNTNLHVSVAVTVVAPGQSVAPPSDR